MARRDGMDTSDPTSVLWRVGSEPHADLLRRLGRSEESRAAYDRAIGLAGNIAETAYLIRRRAQLTGT